MSLYHCFWVGPWRPLLYLSLCSLLKTQTEPNVILWTLAAYVDEYRRRLQSLPVIVKEFRLSVDTRIPFLTPVQQSDYIRHAVLHRYGGMYFDLDMLFLRPIDLAGEWCYRWHGLDCGNTAMLRLEAGSKTCRQLMERGRRIGTFWPSRLYSLRDLPLESIADMRREGIEIALQPTEWFDPAWPAADEGHGSFGYFFQLDCTIEDFYPTALTYHWHNQWDKEILPETIAGRFWRKFVGELHPDG